MGDFNDPFFVKMRQLGRDITGFLLRRCNPSLGKFASTFSVMVTVCVSWKSYDNKRKIDAARAQQKIVKENLMRAEAVYGLYEKEFKEYLARKNKMKSEQFEVEGNVPQDDDTFFTIAGLG